MRFENPDLLYIPRLTAYSNEVKKNKTKKQNLILNGFNLMSKQIANLHTEQEEMSKQIL